MDLEGLCAVREIEQLKYRYVRAVDTHDWPLLRSSMMGDGVLGAHRLHHPEIEPDLAAETATGIWMLTDTAIVAAAGFYLEGARTTATSTG